MLDDSTRALLEAGSSTVVGLLDADGAPFATRGWGTVVVAEAPLRLRVLVSAGALAAAGRTVGDEGFAIAVTGADVHDLRSAQVKGSVVALEPTAEGDQPTLDAFRDDFFGAVEEVDNIPRELMERLVPTDLWACTVAVDEVYDQTPGPAAGRALGL